MKNKIYLLLILAFFSGAALADRPLEQSEILEIFRTLTSQPKETWIASGTIHASHEEYKAPVTTNANEIAARTAEEVQAYLDKSDKVEVDENLQQMRVEAIPFNVRYRLSNEYTMSSQETVRYDGNRFYWEIEVDSREDSIEPPAELAYNGCLMNFDLNWNRKRVFTWDDEKYINYFRPGNRATITDKRGGVNGPLTTGIIPWGLGRYSYKELCSLESSATEAESNGQTEIHLTIADSRQEETFILDADKSYAVKYYSENSNNSLQTVCNYGNYQTVGEQWCPGVIVIEKYDITTKPKRLLSRDIWNFDSISDETLEAENFEVHFEYDALIEDFRFGDEPEPYQNEPIQYRYPEPESLTANGISADELVSLKQQFEFSTDKSGRNCAISSMKCAAERLGTDIPFIAISQAVKGQEKGVSLFDLQQAAAKLGLCGQAVKTNIGTLGHLSKYPAILYLPVNKHYVVLGNVDDNYVGLIDLTDERLYYSESIEDFKASWDGTALIVTTKPVVLKGRFAKLDSSQTKNISGALSGCNLDCDKVIQSYSSSPCIKIGGLCTSHIIYFKRYGCAFDAYDKCYESDCPSCKSETCSVDPDTGNCVGNGDWTTRGSISCCG